MWKQWMLATGGMVLLTACQVEDPNQLALESGEGDLMAMALEFGALPLDDRNDTRDRRRNDRERLGKLLFYDPILSGEKDVSCATCHHPEFGYGDGRDLPIGVGGRGLGPDRIDAIQDDIAIVGRNSPTVINTHFNGIDRQGRLDPDRAPMFWDNRANSLEEQALGPPLNFEEMRGHAFGADVALDSIVARLANIREYRDLFDQAFGGNAPLTADNMARAIADFERTLIAPNSPFDQYVRGDLQAMTDLQKQGLHDFVEAGCGVCHSGPMFSDWEPHAVGIPEHPDRDHPDSGVDGSFAFRTPTLRNLRYTAPYFHNGLAANLSQVMAQYLASQEAAQAGGSPSFNSLVPELDPALARQNLQEGQVEAIIAFMDALNDDNFDRGVPDRVPSGLPVGGNIQL